MADVRREPSDVVPLERTDPILIEIGMDVRLHLHLDLRQFLRVNDVDAESGEPSPEQLQLYFLAILARYLQAQSYMRDAQVTWADDAILS